MLIRIHLWKTYCFIDIVKREKILYKAVIRNCVCQYKMLHVHRSTEKKECNSHLSESMMFNKNIVHCLYNLMQQFRYHKNLTPEMVQQQLEMVFDIDVIDTQFEKLAESVLGQCVQQVNVETEANTLKSVTCKYVYGSRVAANRVKPGTSVPTVGFFTLENKIKMHDVLQIQSKVTKRLLQCLQGIHDELLKAGDISSIKNTNAAKQNTLANFYEHLDYQNELKNRSMHAGLCYRLVEELWDRAPPLYALPPSIKDYTGQSAASLLSWLLGASSKFIFALNKYGSAAKESSILAEVANCWRINTDNSLSPRNCESDIEIIGENIPVSGIVILTDNLKVQLQNHIFARSTRLKNNIVQCDVNPEDFNPQKAFITNGKIRMESTNLFVKDEKQATTSSETKKVEFLKMGSEVFAIYVVDPAYYQGDTTAKNRLKESVKVDFTMPLAVKFKGHSTDDIFKHDDSNAHTLPTKVYFKDARGVTKCIGVEAMIPFVTGMINELNNFKAALNSSGQRLSKLFKLSQITSGRENDVINEQKVKALKNLYNTFPMHYNLSILSEDDVYQKPMWIMISGLTYEALVTNIIALWNEYGFSNALEEQFKRHSLFRRDASHLKEHALSYVQKHNPTLYSWVANNGTQLKSLLVDKLKFPEKIMEFVEFVINLLNSGRLYKELFSSGHYHLGLGFVLNRTETFDSESLLLSRCQGYKLFYSETTTEVKNECQSPNYSLVTSMQTGHMPSSLGHPCIRYPHCFLSEHGNMGAEVISSEFMFETKKTIPNYDQQVWIPIFSMCEADEAQFEDTFNPYGRSNIAFERDSLDYLNADLVVDPLSGVAGYNPMCLGMFNMNFVFHSKLLVSPSDFTMKKHVIPNMYANFWFTEFQNNATKCNNKILMKNLQDNFTNISETSLHFDDLAMVMGGSTCKFCYSNPKMLKTIMSERDNRPLPGRNVYRQQNDYLLHGSKLMENLDRGVNANDRCLLRL